MKKEDYCPQRVWPTGLHIRPIRRKGKHVDRWAFHVYDGNTRVLNYDTREEAQAYIDGIDRFKNLVDVFLYRLKPIKKPGLVARASEDTD